MTLPIFVIGRNRSGTKWLSNIIANHSNVACIQRPGAGGILETNLFYYMPRLFGDLTIDENYYGFLACFAKTNFFKLTQLNEKVLYSTRIDCYYRFFRYIMDLYAQKERKDYWLQKANSLQLEQLLLEFPDAIFVVIQRDLEDNLRSTIGLRELNNQGKPIGGVIRDMFGYYLAHKTENKFKKYENVFIISYESLKREREPTTKDVCKFIGLPYNSNMLIDKYKKNTSFKKGVSKRDMLEKRDLIMIKLYSLIFKMMPWYLYNAVYQLAHRFRGRGPEGKRFVSHTFSLLAHEIEARGNQVEDFTI